METEAGTLALEVGGRVLLAISKENTPGSYLGWVTIKWRARRAGWR